MNRTKIYLTACLLALTTMVFANEKNLEKRVNVYTGGQNMYKLVYKPYQKGLVNISVINEKGKVMMKESINDKNGFIRKYDLNGVEPGKYYFVIQDETGKSTKMINIQREFKVDLDRFGDLISLTAFNHDQELVVNIYDHKDELIVSDRILDKKYSRKNYDISSFYGENLLVEVVDKTGIVESFSLQK